MEKRKKKNGQVLHKLKTAVQIKENGGYDDVFKNAIKRKNKNKY